MLRDKPYKIPVDKKNHAGIVVSLCRFQNPDTSAFTDKELVWRMEKKWHIGLIVKAKTTSRVLELLDSYTARIHSDFHAMAPAPDRSP
jgi:hypothetical protein